MTHLLLSWGYPALFILTVLAAMGIPTGSELVIALAGALASGEVGGSMHHLNVVAVIVVASAGELLGSSFGYGIGRVGGRPLVERLGRYVLVTRHDLDRAEHLFEQRGQSVVFFGRFVPLLRSFIGLAAGIAEMDAPRFLSFTGAATVIWCSIFAALGYGLGSSWSEDLRGVSDLGYGVAVFLVAVVAITIVRRYLAMKRSVPATAKTSDEPPRPLAGTDSDDATTAPASPPFSGEPRGVEERDKTLDENAASDDQDRVIPPSD